MTPRENALIAYRHGTPEWIPNFYTDIFAFMAHPEIERYNGLGIGTDYFGVQWKFVPEHNAPMTMAGTELLDDISNWKDVVKFPDLEAIDWTASAARDTAMNPLAFQAGEKIVPFEGGETAYNTEKLRVCMVINGPFERLHALMGMENAMMALMEDPESCYEYFAAMADYKIAYFRKIAQYYPVDVINAHDDYGANDRMFMSPDTWRQLIKPHLKRIVDAVHEMGLIYQHHSCGYIEPIFEDLVEIGVDAIDTLQACNKNVGELKKKFGKQITFCGGFDTNGVLDMPGVTPEQIKAEYRRVIDLLAPGGSYVIYPISLTFGFVGPFLEEHFRYGMGFYANPNNR